MIAKKPANIVPSTDQSAAFIWLSARSFEAPQTYIAPRSQALFRRAIVFG
jgi:hypothetical protein